MAQCSAWGAERGFRSRERIPLRAVKHGLVPKELLLPRPITDIAAGANRSFAIHQNDRAYGWGTNAHAQTGIPRAAEDENAMITKPTIIKSLEGHGRIRQLDGGNYNSAAVTDGGECLAWGRIDNFATGLKIDSIPTENTVLDTRGGKKEDTDDPDEDTGHRGVTCRCRWRGLPRCHEAWQSL